MLHFNQALGRGVKKLQSPKLHVCYIVPNNKFSWNTDKGNGIVKSKMKKLASSNIFQIKMFHKFSEYLHFEVSTLQLVLI